MARRLIASRRGPTVASQTRKMKRRKSGAWRGRSAATSLSSYVALGFILGAISLGAPAFAAGVNSHDYTCPELQRLILVEPLHFH
jgi:hypothetical protein